jgi:small subunit ribosomal protein S17
MAAKTELTGTIVSDKMAKSRTVAVERQVRHGLYGKTRRLTSTFMAHDELNETKAGDVVVIAESRPLSRRKRWVILRIVKRTAQVAVAAETPARPQR